jgi:hypothetical protein
MKYLASQFSALFPTGETRTNLAALLRYFVFLVVLISVYAVLFHAIMIKIEGQQHSWVTGFYWTLVVITTLGFGDITFRTDIGRLFSIIVLLSGVVFLLVMLPRGRVAQGVDLVEDVPSAVVTLAPPGGDRLAPLPTHQCAAGRGRQHDDEQQSGGGGVTAAPAPGAPRGTARAGGAERRVGAGGRRHFGDGGRLPRRRGRAARAGVSRCHGLPSRSGGRRGHDHSLRDEGDARDAVI